jgi:hypothetical protein
MKTSVKCLCVLSSIGWSIVFSGCAAEKTASPKSIQYQVALERQVQVVLGSSAPQKMTEYLDLIMDCQPLEQPAGLASYEITFRSIQAKRVDFVQTGKFADSAAGLAGKSFTVTVAADGKVASPQLEQELKRLSADSFDPVKKVNARLKNADFLADIWSIQTVVFESASAWKNTKAGHSFQTSCQQVWPIANTPCPAAATVWRREKGDDGDIILKAVDRLSDRPAVNPIPMIYSGDFKMEGLLGYLRNCKIESLDGQIICRMDRGLVLPVTIVSEQAISATAAYTLTQDDPHSEMTVKELLKITAIK